MLSIIPPLSDPEEELLLFSDDVPLSDAPIRVGAIAFAEVFRVTVSPIMKVMNAVTRMRKLP